MKRFPNTYTLMIHNMAVLMTSKGHDTVERRPVCNGNPCGKPESLSKEEYVREFYRDFDGKIREDWIERDKAIGEYQRRLDNA